MSPPNSTFDSGWYFLTIFASSIAPWACGIQWRSIAKTSASSFLILSSASNLSLWSICTAMLTMRVLKPAASRWEEIVMKPIGYISNTGDDGMTSLTGP